MNKHEQAEIKEAIKKEICQILEDIVGLKENSRPIPPDNAIGRLTRMEAINEKSIVEANLRKTKLRLERLNAALDRVDTESFGECVICEGPIPMNRLRVLPESTVCVDCLNNSDD
ncbi:MAG: TraR/DksA C4-type zinc finger protein [Bacteriovoracaceae bacterium]|nr:TraR/DksA C4-type zinc finger protein [Bacteriovoracaceae bacterium]